MITEEIPAKVAADKAYQNAMKNSDKQNARIEHDKALQRVMHRTCSPTTPSCSSSSATTRPSRSGWPTRSSPRPMPQGSVGQGGIYSQLNQRMAVRNRWS